MNRKIAFMLAACGVVGLAQAASAQAYYAPPPVVAPMAPPAVREEVIPAPPGPVERTVWVRGHYEWSGNGYYWVHGHYIERPEPGLIWEPGAWVTIGGRWEWHGGHWRR